MLKHLIIFFSSFMVFSGGYAQEVALSDGPVIKWESTTHDFGDMAQGDRVETTFKFSNTGTAPLIITNVEVTCGCTTPKGWPRDPIPVGGSGEITVAFNSLGKYGRQNKVVKIVSNATAPNQLVFTANVLTKEK